MSQEQGAHKLEEAKSRYHEAMKKVTRFTPCKHDEAVPRPNRWVSGGSESEELRWREGN